MLKCVLVAVGLTAISFGSAYMVSPIGRFEKQEFIDGWWSAFSLISGLAMCGSWTVVFVELYEGNKKDLAG